MNQGKLKVVKQEMARVNVDILEISELKWTGMGEFNSDDHYIYYCGQESLRRNGVAIIVNRRVRNEYMRRLPFLSLGDLPDPGIEPRSPTLQADSLPTELSGKP